MTPGKGIRPAILYRFLRSILFLASRDESIHSIISSMIKEEPRLAASSGSSPVKMAISIPEDTSISHRRFRRYFLRILLSSGCWLRDCVIVNETINKVS